MEGGWSEGNVDGQDGVGFSDFLLFVRQLRKSASCGCRVRARAIRALLHICGTSRRGRNPRPPRHESPAATYNARGRTVKHSTIMSVIAPVFCLILVKSAVGADYDFESVVDSSGDFKRFNFAFDLNTPAINNDGHVAFAASLDNGGYGIFRWTRCRGRFRCGRDFVLRANPNEQR